MSRIIQIRMDAALVSEPVLDHRRGLAVQNLRDRRVEEDLRSRRSVLSPPVSPPQSEADDISRVDALIYNYIACSGPYTPPYADEVETILTQLAAGPAPDTAASLLLRLNDVATHEELLPGELQTPQAASLLFRLAAQYRGQPLVYALVGITVQLVAASDAGQVLLPAGVLPYLDELARSPQLSDRQCYALIVGNLLVNGFATREVLTAAPHCVHRALTSFVDTSGARACSSEFLYNVCWALACLCHEPRASTPVSSPLQLPETVSDCLAAFALAVILGHVNVSLAEGHDALLDSQRHCFTVLCYLVFRNPAMAQRLAAHEPLRRALVALLTLPLGYLMIPAMRLVNMLVQVQAPPVTLWLLEADIHLLLVRIALLALGPRAAHQHAALAAKSLVNVITIPEAVGPCMRDDVVQPVMELVREEVPPDVSCDAAWFVNNLIHYARPEEIVAIVERDDLLHSFAPALALYNISVVSASVATLRTVFDVGTSLYGGMRSPQMRRWLDRFEQGRGVGLLR